MKLLQLYYFKALAESEKLTATAYELYISPSSLSATISRLEGDLGCKLFDRVGRNIRLNDRGRQFYEHVKIALDELDKGFTELKSNAACDRHMTLNVATSTHILWEAPFAEYICDHPHVSFNHRSLKMDQLLNSSETAGYDFILTHYYDLPSSEYDSQVLIENDQPGLVVWEGHPFANLKEIPLAAARDEPFVALSKGFSMRNFFDYLCKKAQFQPNIVAETDYALRATLVRGKYGIALSTVSGAQSIYLSGLRFIPISDPDVPRVQTLFWRKDKKLSAQAESFKNFLTNYFQNEKDAFSAASAPLPLPEDGVVPFA